MSHSRSTIEHAGTNSDRVYPDPLQHWPERATVRGPIVDFELETDRLALTPELVPAQSHPLVQKLGDHALSCLYAHELLAFLAFTDADEHEAVIPAAYALGRDPRAFGIAPKAGRDARLIVADEGYHAYVAVELAKAIADRFEVRLIDTGRPRFLRCLDAVKAELPESFLEHLVIAFACVSEVSVTSMLRRIPRDPRVATAVRRVMEDHAQDEGRHANYYAYVLQRLWPSWSREQRSVLGPLFGRLLRLFLEPDLALITLELEAIGLDPNDADIVIRHCYSPEQITLGVRAGAAVPLRLMERIGILDDGPSRAGLISCGLID